MPLNLNTIIELSDENEASNLSVTELRFDNKDIESLGGGVFNRYESLQELYLSVNKITQLPQKVFLSLTELKIINLYNNKLTALHPNLFKANRKLEVINVGRNYITEINEEKLLKNLPELRKFYFNGNRITTFNFESLKESRKLKLLWFHNNNLREIKDLESFKQLFPKLRFCGVENRNFSYSYMQSVIQSLERQGIEIYIDKGTANRVDPVKAPKCVPSDDVQTNNLSLGKEVEKRVSDTEAKLKQLSDVVNTNLRIEMTNSDKEIKGLDNKCVLLEAAHDDYKQQNLQLAKQLKDTREEMCKMLQEMQQQQTRSDAELKALREERGEEAVTAESEGRNMKALFIFINRKVDGQIINYNEEIEKLGAEHIKLRDDLTDTHRKLEEALEKIQNMQQEQQQERSVERQPYADQKDIGGLTMDIRNAVTTTTLIHGEVVKIADSNQRLSTEFQQLRCDFDQLSDEVKLLQTKK